MGPVTHILALLKQESRTDPLSVIDASSTIPEEVSARLHLRANRREVAAAYGSTIRVTLLEGSDSRPLVSTCVAKQS